MYLILPMPARVNLKGINIFLLLTYASFLYFGLAGFLSDCGSKVFQGAVLFSFIYPVLILNYLSLAIKACTYVHSAIHSIGKHVKFEKILNSHCISIFFIQKLLISIQKSNHTEGIHIP